MGLFGPASSPFDADVEKVTNEKNTTEQWNLIMDVCDRAGASAGAAKDCLRSIWKRLNHPDPHVALQACTLLDACVNNSGRHFHLEVASRGFENEYRKIIGKAHLRVKEKLRELLLKWAVGDFKTDPQLNIIPTLLAQLKDEGLDFTPHHEPKPRQNPGKPADPYAVSSQQEEDDLVKAITLSLKESSPKSAASALYPSTAPSSTAHTSHSVEAKKVRALYDFEAVEDNELTFKAGELIHVLDDTDPNWWKGYNKRGEGLFPANFVTADLSAEPENFKPDQPKKTVQFSESVTVKTLKQDDVEINEEKIDRLLHLLHEANPEEDHSDTAEMLNLEEQVNMMGPLIDTELERVDRKHAQLTQLSADLVEALNLYHTLMREQSSQPPQVHFQPKGPFGFPSSPAHAFNGGPPHGMPLGPMGPQMGPQMGPPMGPPLGPPMRPQGYSGLADYGSSLGPNSLPPMSTHYMGQASGGAESLQYPNSLYAANHMGNFGAPSVPPFMPHGLPNSQQPHQPPQQQPQAQPPPQQPPPPGVFSPPTQPLL